MDGSPARLSLAAGEYPILRFAAAPNCNIEARFEEDRDEIAGDCGAGRILVRFKRGGGGRCEGARRRDDGEHACASAATTTYDLPTWLTPADGFRVRTSPPLSCPRSSPCRPDPASSRARPTTHLRLRQGCDRARSARRGDRASSRRPRSRRSDWRCPCPRYQVPSHGSVRTSTASSARG